MLECLFCVLLVLMVRKSEGRIAIRLFNIDTNIDAKQIIEHKCIVNMININDFDLFNAWKTASLPLSLLDTIIFTAHLHLFAGVFLLMKIKDNAEV